MCQIVHCRLRRVDSRKHAAPSSSANTYWQIENQENPISGEYNYHAIMKYYESFVKVMLLHGVIDVDSSIYPQDATCQW